jgi:hypothetical protein
MSFTRDDVQMDKLISVREAVKFGSVRELDVVVSKIEQNVILDAIKVMIIKIAQ